MRAIQIRNTGGPKVLELLDIAEPSMADDEALIDISLAGINYIDIYHREGRYPKPLPFIPGAEGIGTIRKLGSNSPQDLKIGMRVGWVMHTGGYAEVAAIPSASLIPIPSDIADDAAVTLLLQGMTAHYLAEDSYKISRNDTVVVHSAAGGVGLLLTRYAASMGANVLATCSTAAKREMALQEGAAHAVNYDSFVKAAQEMTSGVGADAVYDGVGAATFLDSIAALRRRGSLVSYGNASGSIPAFEPKQLLKSIFFSRPSLGDHVATRTELLSRSSEVFQAYREDRMRVHLGGIYSLENIQQAHIDLESRVTSGKLLVQVRS